MGRPISLRYPDPPTEQGDPNPPIAPAVQVSFDRPYRYAWFRNRASNGAGDFFRAEINMVRWLEKDGRDVTYSTNIDTHRDANALLRHKAFLSIGHDEYWSWPMRANVERARDSGVSLGFFSSNSAYWQIRLADSTTQPQQPNRIIVAHKATALSGPAESVDPFAQDTDTTNDRLITTRWRDAPVNRPEEMLIGVQYELPNVFDGSPQVGDIKVTLAEHWLYQNTRLRETATPYLAYFSKKSTGSIPALQRAQSADRALHISSLCVSRSEG